MIPVSMTLDDLAKIKREITMGAPYAHRMSFGLTVRLVAHPRDAATVLREIGALEGIQPATTTKPAKQFKHPPLAPLWHKHFFACRHVARNIGDRWNVSKGEGNRDLNDVLAEIAAKCGNDPARWPSAVSHRFIIGGLNDRSVAGRLTGDWIVFAKCEGENYYLDLATHEEGEAANASRLMEKLKAGSAAEFPFAFSASAPP
jgi:hypothetical protein